MKVSQIVALLLAVSSLSLPACQHNGEEHKPEEHKVILTSPKEMDVVLPQQYVCQIRSQRHINVRALETGYLEAIHIKEGQEVKAGQVMFKVIPVIYQAKYDAEKAEVRHAELEYKFTAKLAEDNSKAATPVVSKNEVLLYQAKLARAEARLKLSLAELNFATVKAPFDGIIDRLMEMQGSLVKEGDTLTTLSDNSVMWVYFNVPEARYLEYKALQRKSHENHRLELVDSTIELILADGNKFNQHPGNVVTIEGQFNNQTGNIAFRADFPNPDRLLRHGQTGTVVIHRKVKNALVIPQRATYEILDKRYVYVVDKDNVVHQRDIEVQNEKEDIFILKPAIRHKGVITGLEPGERIVLEGVRQVRNEQELEDFEFEKPEDALDPKHLKFRAE